MGYLDATTRVAASLLLVEFKSLMTLALIPIFGAAGYSAMYLLGGGGIVGAAVIFVVAKAMGK